MADAVFFSILMSSVFVIVICGRDMLFIHETNVMYQTSYTSQTADTMVHCLVICSLENGCIAVNYNTGTHICQLTSAENLNKQQTDVDDGWIAAIRGTYLPTYHLPT